MLRYIDELEVAGIAMGGEKVRHLRGRLWELRPLPNRVLYFTATGRRCVLLRTFKKKSQDTPESEMTLAESRMNDHIAREGG